MKMTLLGSRWKLRSAPELAQSVDLPQSYRNGTSTWKWRGALKRALRLNPNGLAERSSAGGGQRQVGGVHAELDREVPGPASPLFKKRRRVLLS
eukprot:2372597-Amphidinium_carterae.1